MAKRPKWEGEDISEFLMNLEPFKQGLGESPIKSIRYAPYKVEIEFFTETELDAMWIDWDDLEGNQ